MAGPEAALPLYRRARRASRLAFLLLALDIGQAWMVAAAGLLFAERLWFVLAGYAIEEATLEDHLRQFHLLRGTQLLTALLTLAVVGGWAHRALRVAAALGADTPPDPARRPRPRWRRLTPFFVMRTIWPRRRGLAARSVCLPAAWWGVLAAAAFADAAIRVLSALGRPPLSIGGILPLLVLGELLKIAACVLTIGVIWRVDQGQWDAVGRP